MTPTKLQIQCSYQALDLNTDEEYKIKHLHIELHIPLSLYMYYKHPP